MQGLLRGEDILGVWTMGDMLAENREERIENLWDSISSAILTSHLRITVLPYLSPQIKLLRETLNRKKQINPE